ncbi:MAG: hypothetical protein FJ086_09195 [Deltaproteobacteria bacterium]|nr:hypothetical protein [Deltaproteobacteria bacterium]
MIRTAAVALVCAGACRGSPGVDGAPAPAAAGGAPAGRVVVHIRMLPEGWRADSISPSVMLAGPAGRPVLRVEAFPGKGAELPTAVDLEGAFSRALPGAAVRRIPGGEERPDFVAVRLELQRLPDGGTGGSRDVLLGARRVGRDLYLCATEPGASDPEMDDAQEACRDFTVP